ncbi:hypothetical protein LTR56_009792 [Elasticomyces elasticus]|nr:hypothetical protein LTR56_009792 [Elasticomyces elasticus]KAK3653485.1 hypothetical protein LTR22_011159 [Elasticomyces elasticus]KAK4906911.1 hypothetical protein LTR49_024004 [Elasticomyces elasticus]KAK5746967.1 hypothetical protein LTS12_022588 [Elasticomyces elasticus]
MGKASLLGLPPELREIIWSLVLVEPEPIIADMLRRTAKPSRPPDDFCDMKTVRQSLRMPPLPALACVSRTLSKAEIVPIYFGNNTFCFHADRHTEYDVNTWFEGTVELGKAVLGKDHARTFIEQYLSIRVEFDLPYAGPSTIDFSYCKKDDEIRVHCGGPLKDQCICELEREMRDERVWWQNGGWLDAAMEIATHTIRRHLYDYWLGRGEEEEDPIASCSQCKKVQYASTLCKL